VSRNQTLLRLALADDQALIREGLKAVLQAIDDMTVALEADSGSDLIERLDECAIDVIISDIRMPGLDGIEMTRRLRQQGSTIPVLLLTTFDDDELLPRAAEAGAQGFLLKDVAPKDLASAVRRLADGGSLLQPVTTEAVRSRYRYDDDALPEERFGPREIEILRLLAGGYSNREIAQTIHLAEGTVKNYVSEILAKLGTRDRTRAVLKAITLRII
jgi:DNA-binding NarL/FixJ family response regulator